MTRKKVKYVKVAGIDRFIALQSGNIDVLLANTTWSNEWEARFDLPATDPIFFDGQGFLVRKALRIARVADLARRSICVERGTISELNLTDYFGSSIRTLAFIDRDEALKAYGAGNCDALTGNQSSLYVARLSLGRADEHVVMPDLISRIPLSPFVRQGDDIWFNIIRWVHFAMVEAEALGITRTNADRYIDSNDSNIKPLFQSNTSVRWGLTSDWAYRVVKQVGNYGEVFDENSGLHSPFAMARGLNDLWTKGGLYYPSRFR